jgi:peroxiredoxin
LRERSALQALFEKYRERGFTILAVSMDSQGAEIVAPYKKKHGLTFLHLLDSERSVSRLYGVRGTPTNYILDRMGRVVAGSIGYRDFASPQAHSLIEALLDEKEKEEKGRKIKKEDSRSSPGS